MGEYFHYVNHNKQMVFGIGALGGAIKFSGIGCNLGARAFCLLLTKSNDRAYVYKHTWMGSWIGDRVLCIGDHGTLQDEYYNYKIVTANIILMLYQIDGSEDLIKAAKLYDGLFVQIAYLIFTQQLKGILSDFEQEFGKEWSKQYKEKWEKFPYYQVYDLVC